MYFMFQEEMLAVCTFLIYAKLLKLNLVYGISFFFYDKSSNVALNYFSHSCYWQAGNIAAF